MPAPRATAAKENSRLISPRGRVQFSIVPCLNNSPDQHTQINSETPLKSGGCRKQPPDIALSLQLPAQKLPDCRVHRQLIGVEHEMMGIVHDGHQFMFYAFFS